MTKIGLELKRRMRRIGFLIEGANSLPALPLRVPVEERDIEGIEKALNEDAGKASAIWITFITFELYLVMTFGSVTYRDLLLETPLKLPLLGTELPLLGFSEVAPTLLVIFHFYILVQLTIFDQKLITYDAVLRRAFPFASDREQARQRLGFFFRVQSAYGAKQQRHGIVGLSLKLIGWLTLVAAPVLILLQSLLTFLPYHNQQAVWTIRALMGVDVLLVICFWGVIAGSAPSEDKKSILVRPFLRISNAAVLLAILGFSVAVATYPGEEFTERLPYRASLDGLRAFLFGGEVDEVTGRPRSYLSNRIIATGQLLTSDQQDKIRPIKSLRGRDLREAVFTRSDLRGVDFTGSMLNGAVFTEARLQGANFGCSDTGASKENKSWLEEKRNLPWPDDGCTWLQNAIFNSANLQQATFFFSHLEGSEFSDADLSKAEFSFVKLNGATFSGARLVGVALHKSEASGSSFFSADLRGASFFETDFTGSIFLQTNLQAAALNRAIFDGSLFLRAKLQGAILDDVSLRGTFVIQSKFWRARWRPEFPPTIELTNVHQMDGSTPPWDDDVDPKKRTFPIWQQTMLSSVSASADDAARLSALDPKKPAASNADLKGFVTKQQPKFQVENQLTLLIDLICSDDADYSIARRIVGAVNTIFKEGLLSSQQQKLFSSDLLDRSRKGKCIGAEDADGDFWSQLDRPGDTSYSDFLTKSLSP